MRKVDVFDTTLRDGEQSAGVNLHPHEKLEIALQLERFGVDIMEAGFPASSAGDFHSVSEIARLVKNSSVTGLARASKGDIDAAWEALKHGAAPRLHVFIATSPIHMKYKLRMEPDAVVEAAVDAVKYGARKFSLIEWSAEDATRSEWPFLAKIIEKVIAAGANVINLPDTVGYTTPEEYVNMFRYIQEHVRNIHKVKLSAHCHDDLGLAVANSLAAIEAGVGQIEGTINGIGERAGNAALEEVLVALAIRKAKYQTETNIDLSQTALTSKLVSKLSGMSVPRNKAVVGSNAFAHESGIHQDGVLKNTLTYEIIRPEMVGYSSNKMVMGKHSGRHAFHEKCKELGIRVEGEEFNQLFESFKALTDRKKVVTDDDILALSLEAAVPVNESKYELEFLHVSYAAQETTAAMAVRTPEDEVIREVATGKGSVEAIYNAFERVIGENVTLEDYRIQSTTSGQDSFAEVYVDISWHEILGSGRGVDNDVLAASAKAFLDAVSRIACKQEFIDGVSEAITAER